LLSINSLNTCNLLLLLSRLESSVEQELARVHWRWPSSG